MDNKKRKPLLYRALPYIVMLVLGLAIAGLLLYIIPYRYGMSQKIVVEESVKVPDNPLTGFAPPAENESDCAKTRLVYIRLTWAEWEPEDGVYDIKGLEEKYHIARWREEKKHAVLRFVCDIPSDEKHMDIPQWLYDQTKDGAYYSGDYGQGYAPDYGNAYFRKRHKLALQALAQYCNQDDFVAYVELGSLGHWGEWHTDGDLDIPQMPDADICWQYVLDYTDQFYNARMLMRRNYVMAAEGGLGLYNDMTGSAEDTKKWLSWISDGGSQTSGSTVLEYGVMDDFWEKAPVGGELTSSYEMEELLGRRLIDTLSQVEESHMTFLGPNCPSGEQLDSDAANTIRESMGYRYYISELETRYSFGEDRLVVTMNWRNTGLAPLYWDWPVTMYVYDKEGTAIYWETLDLKLSELVPGEDKKVTASIPFDDSLRDGYEIGIGITNPYQDEHLLLAMECEVREDGVQVVCSAFRE